MRRDKVLLIVALSATALILQVQSAIPQPATAELSAQDLYDKIHGGWLGQMIGVTLGGPYEFNIDFPGPEIEYYKSMPSACSDQDDIYVELVSLITLQEHGINATPRQIGENWLKHLTPNRIWVANRRAYENMSAGIWPPDSGHPRYNGKYQEIDAQIEADLWGLISPGMINVAAEYASRAAHISNWDEGVNGALFMAAAYSEAFFEDDVHELVRRALAVVPPESDYAEMVHDMIAWHEQFPEWRDARNALAEKWAERYSRVSAIVNSGGVLLGLLYGDGDFGRTIRVATMAGWDADCNPSSAGGIVGTMIGANAIPAKWKAPLNDTYTNRTLEKLPPSMKISDLADRALHLAEQVITAHGGAVRARDGRRVYVIPREQPRPRPLEELTPEDEAQIAAARREHEAKLRAVNMQAAAKQWDGSWKIRQCGPDMSPGYKSSYGGRSSVLMTHPLDRETPCVLERTVEPPPGKRHTLKVAVTSYDGNQQADWELRVKVNGELIDRKIIGRVGGELHWHELSYDLSRYAGKRVTIALENAADEWSWEAGYWDYATIVSE